MDETSWPWSWASFGEVAMSPLSSPWTSSSTSILLSLSPSLSPSLWPLSTSLDDTAFFDYWIAVGDGSLTTLLLSAMESTGISSSLVSSAGFVELYFLRFEEDYCCYFWAVKSDADATFLISTSISAVGSGFSSELLGELRVALPDCYFLAVLF